MVGTIYTDANDHIDLQIPTELGKENDLEKSSKVLLLNPKKIGNFKYDTMAIAEDYFSQK